METNRLIEFVEDLNSKNIRDWDNIFKQLNVRFGNRFRLNKIEANYLTKYYKSELNFNTKIISINSLNRNQ